MSKMCSKCGESKPIEAFYKRKRSSDGLYGKCKTCKIEYQKEYYAKNKEKVNACRIKRYAENKEKMKEYRIKNRERIAEQNRKYREANKERVYANAKEWQKNNLDIRRQIGAKRRAAKMQRIPCWLTEDDKVLIQRKYTLAHKKTESTGERWVVDHILPLQGKLVSGLHVPANLRVIKEITNLRKHNKYTPV